MSTNLKYLTRPKKTRRSGISWIRISNKIKTLSFIAVIALIGVGYNLYSHAATNSPASLAGITCPQYTLNTIVYDQNHNAYDLNTDRYGGGLQCAVNTNGGANFTVGGTASGNGSTVVAYPNLIRGCSNTKCYSPTWPKRVGTLPIWLASSRFSTNGSTGSWNANYDLWFNRTNLIGPSRGTELLINLDRQGRNPPTGYWAKHTTFVENNWYDVYIYPRSQTINNVNYTWNYVQYWRRNTTTTTTNLNLTHIMQNAESFNCPYHASCIDAQWFWTAIDSGFEIWSGGIGLQWNSSLIQAQ